MIGRRAFVLALALAAGACETSGPEGFRPASLDGVMVLAKEFWGLQHRSLDVSMVRPNCIAYGTVDSVTGFMLDNLCVWGGALGDEAYISTRAQNLYSRTSLMHELGHFKVGDHDHSDENFWGKRTDPAWPNGGFVGMGNAFLQRNAEIDTIEPAVQP